MADIRSWLSTSTPTTKPPKVEQNLFAETARLATPKIRREQKTLAIAQRTRALFNVITRPPLLYNPSLGINLPFAANDSAKLSTFEKISKGLKELACSDPCLVSVDGLLDGIFAARNAIEHLYDDCCAMEDRKHSESNEATLSVLDFFLTRSKFSYRSDLFYCLFS